MAELLVLRPHLYLIHFHHLAIVSQEAVHLTLAVGSLRIDSRREAALHQFLELIGILQILSRHLL